MSLDLKNLLANPDFSRKEKLLIILAASKESLSVGKIRDVAIENGLNQIKGWNISSILKALEPEVVRLPGGWSMTDGGTVTLQNLGVLDTGPAQSIQPTLRKYLTKINSDDVRAFLDEAVQAVELKLYRSAVVLAWVGAVFVLYEEVLSNHLSAFNAEALKRFPKWKAAQNSDDLARMKEYDFLQVIHAISVIGKNTKDDLEQCLKLRNACGHPNTHKVGEHKVTAHLETLMLNVYAKFVI